MSLEGADADDMLPETNMDDDYHRGYKIGWNAANDQSIPAIGPTQINCATFLIDSQGTAWWIDPIGRKCERIRNGRD